MVRREKDFVTVQRVAGLDVGFEQDGKITRAAVVVLSFPDLILVERALVRQPTRFPYVPGLLSFREAPALLEALSQLSQAPDLLLCDGQGLAHPRRCGLACHLGLLTGIPCYRGGEITFVWAACPPGGTDAATGSLCWMGMMLSELCCVRARGSNRCMYQ